jgi:hypothetical protein
MKDVIANSIFMCASGFFLIAGAIFLIAGVEDVIESARAGIQLEKFSPLRLKPTHYLRRIFLIRLKITRFLAHKSKGI